MKGEENMKVRLRLKRHFEVMSGDKLLGTFEEKSRWNGMVELAMVGGGGLRTLIVEVGNPSELFFKELCDLEAECEVVKASPLILEQLTR